MLRDVLTLAGAFAVGTALAEALGASNLGIAIGFGQLTFMAALIWTLLQRG